MRSLAGPIRLRGAVAMLDLNARVQTSDNVYDMADRLMCNGLRADKPGGSDPGLCPPVRTSIGLLPRHLVQADMLTALIPLGVCATNIARIAVHGEGLRPSPGP